MIFSKRRLFFRILWVFGATPPDNSREWSLPLSCGIIISVRPTDRPAAHFYGNSMKNGIFTGGLTKNKTLESSDVQNRGLSRYTNPQELASSKLDSPDSQFSNWVPFLGIRPQELQIWSHRIIVLDRHRTLRSLDRLTIRRKWTVLHWILRCSNFRKVYTIIA